MSRREVKSRRAPSRYAEVAYLVFCNDDPVTWDREARSASQMRLSTLTLSLAVWVHHPSNSPLKHTLRQLNPQWQF
jgi:hypothetical protein